MSAGVYHVTGHLLQPVVQVVRELLVRPVKLLDEGLQGPQLPEQVHGGGAPSAETWKKFLDLHSIILFQLLSFSEYLVLVALTLMKRLFNSILNKLN